MDHDFYVLAKNFFYPIFFSKGVYDFRLYIKIYCFVELNVFSSVAQSCPAACDPKDCGKPGFTVHHQLPEPAQTHVPWVGDAIQPSHPLLSPSPSAFSLSQHQGLFQWVSSLHQVAKILELELQDQSFQWILRTDFIYNWMVLSSCSPRHSQKSSPTPQFKASVLWRSAFFMVQLSHPYITTGKTIPLTRWTFVGKIMSLLFNILSRLVTAFFQGISIF